MTETYAGTTVADDIVDEALDSPSARLERQADAILDEDRAFAPRPLRQALSEDATAARDWGRERAVLMRDSIEAEPLKATLYALGVGVFLGMLLRR